jgi:hypothetical protein
MLGVEPGGRFQAPASVRRFALFQQNQAVAIGYLGITWIRLFQIAQHGCGLVDFARGNKLHGLRDAGLPGRAGKRSRQQHEDE